MKHCIDSVSHLRAALDKDTEANGEIKDALGFKSKYLLGGTTFKIGDGEG